LLEAAKGLRTRFLPARGARLAEVICWPVPEHRVYGDGWPLESEHGFRPLSLTPGRAEAALPVPAGTRFCRLEVLLFSDLPRVVTLLVDGRERAVLTVDRMICASFIILAGAARTVITLRDAMIVAAHEEIAKTEGLAVVALRLFGLDREKPWRPPPGPSSLHQRPEMDPVRIHPAELMQRFSSLGGNCEFGIAQRCFGAEPNDLYRFANLGLGSVVHAIDRRFEGISRAERMYIGAGAYGDGGNYYYIYQYDYQIPFSTGIRDSEMTLETCRQVMLDRFSLLSRSFMEELEDGEQILVVKRHTPFAASEIDALVRQIRAIGDCYVMFVEQQASPDQLAGLVRRIAPGVLRGYLRRFADGERVVETINAGEWLTLCQKAYRIWWEERAGRPSPGVLPTDFDPLAYLHANPDVAASGIDPARHYLGFGVFEGRRRR
jgi:hypothetical protein